MSEPTLALFIEYWSLLYRDPVITAVVAGAVLGWLGVYIVMRRMVFVTAAVSQAAGLGVALAFWVQIVFSESAAHPDHDSHPVIGAVLMSFAATLLFAIRTDALRISREAILGLAYVGFGGLTVVIGDRIHQEAHDISAILFGTAVVVRPDDMFLVCGAGAFVIAILSWWHRGFVFAAFDPEGAKVHGLPVQLLDVVLWMLVALMVSLSTRALGALPVFAFAVLPAVAALLATTRLTHAIALATLFGATAGGLGYLLSFLYVLPVGATQTVTAAALVLLMVPLRLLRGPS